MTKLEAIKKLLAWASAQVGYPEGSNNYNKYAADPRMTKLLGWNAQNQPWCNIFANEAFIECFGLEDGAAMIYQPIGKGSALCKKSAQFFKDNGAWSQTPEPGDVVFFYVSGAINHQGLVESVSGGIVHTIEGNSSDKVSRHSYAVGVRNIAGYGKPKWSLVVGKDTDAPATPEVPVDDPPKKETLFKLEFRELQEGCQGEDVRAAQLLLIGRGCGCGRSGADADFGPNTRSAVVKFQKKRKLEADGVIGEKTLAALMGVD